MIALARREQKFERIYYYIYAAHPRLMQLLRRYEDEGLVEVVPFSSPALLPHGNPTWAQIAYELRQPEFVRLQHVSRYDCFYR